MIHEAIPQKVRFAFNSSNYDGESRWGSFRMDVCDEDGSSASVYLEKDEMVDLARQLIWASEQVVE